jgi:uncharacterized protein with PQ loop repeat
VRGGRAVNFIGYDNRPRCGLPLQWSLVPQLLKCWRDGLTEAVSKKMFATRAFGLVLWVVYGFFAGSPPVMIFSSVNLVLSITILVLTLRNSSHPEAHIA